MLVPVVNDGPGAERIRTQQLSISAVDQPSLTLLTFENSQAGVTTLDLRLVAPGLGFNFKKYEQVCFATDPSSYFRDLFAQVDAMGRRRADLALRLERKGCHLFQTFLPPDLQSDLWTLRDRIESVQVQSEEPWVPWEILKLCGKTVDGFEETQSARFEVRTEEDATWLAYTIDADPMATVSGMKGVPTLAV